MTDANNAEKLVARFPVRKCVTRSGVVSYRDEGAGYPLVLLHGISSQSGSWIRQFETLVRQFRVVAWDAPGYGDTQSLAHDAPKADDYASVLEQFLEAIGIRHCVLVASSLGALIATAFAARSPTCAVGLVLLNPAGGYGLADANERESRLAARLERLARLGPQGLAAEASPGMLSGAADEEARSIAAWSTSRILPDGYIQASRMLAGGRLLEDAPRYAGPVLVVATSADTITPAPACASLAQAFPNGSCRLLPGPGHLSYLEAPAAINEMIADAATGWFASLQSGVTR